MNEFAHGMSVTACLVAALFFLKFWQSTQDRLLLIFAISFTLMALTRLVLAIISPLDLHSTWAYTPRLLAYLLILAAIIDKNRPRAVQVNRPE